MAIGTYAQLQTAIAAWAHRTGDTTFTDYVPDMIALFEARANDMLLLKNMESDEPLALTIGQNYVALPTGYISPLAFWLVIGGQRVEVDQCLPTELPYSASNNQPSMWAIDGANIRFDCPASQAYTAYLRMVKASNLSAIVTTNYLLTKRPDVYLAGCMVEAGRFMKKPEVVAEWEGKLQAAAAGLTDAEHRSRSGVPMRSDVPGATARRIDVRRGY